MNELTWTRTTTLASGASAAHRERGGSRTVERGAVGRGGIGGGCGGGVRGHRGRRVAGEVGGGGGGGEEQGQGRRPGDGGRGHHQRMSEFIDRFDEGDWFFS